MTTIQNLKKIPVRKLFIEILNALTFRAPVRASQEVDFAEIRAGRKTNKEVYRESLCDKLKILVQYSKSKGTLLLTRIYKYFRIVGDFNKGPFFRTSHSYTH